MEDVDSAFEYAVTRGALPAMRPVTIEDANGRVRRAAIHTYGDTVHSFISRHDYAGSFMPGYRSVNLPGNDSGILRIDHIIVGNVELGRMDEWARLPPH